MSETAIFRHSETASGLPLRRATMPQVTVFQEYRNLFTRVNSNPPKNRSSFITQLQMLHRQAVRLTVSDPRHYRVALALADLLQRYGVSAWGAR